MHLNATVLIGSVLTLASIASAAADRDLVDDYSRGDLMRYAMSLEPDKAFPAAFLFPKDTNRDDVIFGIDVSHHDGTIDWSNARANGIQFAYVKASQGEVFVDKTFTRNWSALTELYDEPAKRIHRGAYHFLSARGDPKIQAELFLEIYKNRAKTDLPPCVDLEWDVQAGESPADDHWKDHSPDQIVARVLSFLEIVEKGTKQKPIIYTAPAWWDERIKPVGNKLANYKIWIADYRSKALLSEKPRVPSSLVSPLWQFSESGRVRAGFTTKVDVNVYKGNMQQLLVELGLSPVVGTGRAASRSR